MTLKLILFVGIACSFYSITFAQRTGMAASDGVEIRYTVFGEGSPLLVLNGGPGMPSTHFAGLAQRLAEGRQVILFDQRGTGASVLEQADSTTVTIDKMVEDIEAVRRKLDIESWAVMGHSWGGMYAMLYAARHPERISCLILSASGGINLDFAQYLNANIRSRLSAEEVRQFDYYSRNPGEPGAREKRIKAMAPAYVFHREHVPTVVRYLAVESNYVPQVNSLVWQALFAVDYDLEDELAEFRKPVLILQGRQDLLGEGTAYQAHLAFPNSRLEFINECSHYLWLDQPGIYFGHIEHFLQENSTDGG